MMMSILSGRLPAVIKLSLAEAQLYLGLPYRTFRHVIGFYFGGVSNVGRIPVAQLDTILDCYHGRAPKRAYKAARKAA